MSEIVANGGYRECVALFRAVTALGKPFFFFSTKRQQIKQQPSGIKNTILRDSQGPAGTASFSHSSSREGRSAARDPLRRRVYTTSSLSGSPPFVCGGASGASALLPFVAVFPLPREVEVLPGLLLSHSCRVGRPREAGGDEGPREFEVAAVGTSPILPDSDVLFCSPPFFV